MNSSSRSQNEPARPFPIWVGLECTYNRVQDQFFNQCERSGHTKRIQDLEMFASLGAEKIRYPFLWEMAATKSSHEFNWKWADQRMAELRRVGLKPIVGLVHNGSGPRSTNLLDPEFPQKLAVYARQFAERFPDQIDYTPINEPLMTARLSCLSGYWYPHHKSNHSFLKALLNQVKGVILSMKAIREVQPSSRMIQTESLGKTQGTSFLQSQIDFENDCRWLSFDLLQGRVDQSHPLYWFFNHHGICPVELAEIREMACGIDVVGLNYDLRSNRYLDHRIQYYPEAFLTGNENCQYAEIGAAETTAAEVPEPAEILREAWARYQKPIAVTETYLHGHRESQMRWLLEIHEAFRKVQSEGVQIEAITVGSLIGSFDSSSFYAKKSSLYESGVFDLRGPWPRETVLAKQIRRWNQGRTYWHPLQSEAGWWRDSSKKKFGPPVLKVTQNAEERILEIWNTKSHLTEASQTQRPILVIGCKGILAQAFGRICALRNIPVMCLGRESLNVCDSFTLSKKVRALRPWALINAAGFSQVDRAEKERQQCYSLNVIAAKNLAQIAESLGIPFVHFSSDLVFDGVSHEPYLESDPVSPICFYGETKAASEKLVQTIHEKSLVIRTSSLFGPWDQKNFVFGVIKRVLSGEKLFAPYDVCISPTYIPHLVHGTLDLLIDEMTGVVHLTNRGETSWAEWARRIAEKWNRAHLVAAVTSEEMFYQAKRPRYSVLSSERVSIMPKFEEGFSEFFLETRSPFM